MSGPQRHRCLAVFVFAASSALLGRPGPAAAADDDPDALLASVHAAVADGSVVQSRVLGFNNPNKQFTELPSDGALLVGLDVGLGKFFNIECVYAFRAVYLGRGGEITLDEHGLFRDKRLPKNKTLKSKVLRTVHIQARPGYAVGGVTVRSGLDINGLALTFMRIDGGTLDPRQSYTSEWVGDRTGGSEATIDCAGAPVVGLFGSQDEEHASALGLYFLNQPAPAVAPPVLPPVAPPVLPPAAPPVLPPAAPPVERPDVPPRVQKPMNQPAEPPRVQPAANPPADPPREADEPAAVPVKVAAPAPAPAKEPPGTVWWAYLLPVAAFGGATALVFVVVLAFSGRKAPVVKRNERRPTGALTWTDASTAFSERPAPTLETRPAPDGEVMELSAEDIVPEEDVLELGAEDLEPEPKPCSPDRWPRLEL